MLTIKLWNGDTVATTPETYDKDAREALAAWCEPGDCVRRFDDGGVARFYVFTEGERTDACAMVRL